MNVLIFAILLIVVLVVLALPFWRKHQQSTDSNTSNLAIYRTQIIELDQDLTEGKIDQQQHKIATLELKKNLGLSLTETSQLSASYKPKLATMLIIFTVLFVGVGTYSLVGNFNYPPVKTINPDISIKELIKILQPKLQQNPNNVDELIMLAKLYQKDNKMDLAIKTYRRALRIEPKNSNINLFLAYAVGFKNSGNFSGEPLELLQKSLQLDSKNQDAAYLIGRHYFQIGELQKSIEVWQKLLPLLNQENTKEVLEDITIAQQKLNGKHNSKIKVAVSLDKSLKPNPNHTVFISVHAQTGPPMPLAAVKLKVKDLPTTIGLDNSNSLIPNLTISKFEKIFIKARISASGSADLRQDDISARTGVISNKTTNRIYRIVLKKPTE